jgi:protoheme ferro-lyase
LFDAAFELHAWLVAAAAAQMLDRCLSMHDHYSLAYHTTVKFVIRHWPPCHDDIHELIKGQKLCCIVLLPAYHASIPLSDKKIDVHAASK